MNAVPKPKKRKKRKSQRTLDKNRQEIRLNKKHAYLVKHRDGFKCVLTGEQCALDDHHVLGRKGALKFWDLRASVSLKSGLHFRLHHADEWERARLHKMVQDYIGPELYEELFRIGNQIFKKTNDECEEHLNELAVKQGIIWKDVIPEATYKRYWKGVGDV